MHHLVTDTVSWRIITEDLQRVYAYLSAKGKGSDLRGVAVREILGSKGSSYRQWVEAVGNYCEGDKEQRKKELDYWSDLLAGVAEGNALLEVWSTEEKH